jgi:hypothetical protein
MLRLPAWLRIMAPALLLALAPARASADETAIDPAAASVVESMMGAMGGRQAFENVGALRFSFSFSSKDTVRSGRTHWWDRRTGDYRIQGKTRQGQDFVYLFNTGTKEGRAWVGGAPADSAGLKAHLDRAYALFINDTYWFLMPFKLFDPGVHLKLDGETTVGGAPVDRVKVTFDNVGLTPGDTYWAYIDRESHLMTRWGFVLQDATGEPEQLYDWTGWTSFGPIRLSTARVKVLDKDRTVIHLQNVQVIDSFPPDVFTNPAPIPL